MKRYLPIFFLLINILFSAGCSPTKGLIKDRSAGAGNLQPILNGDFKTVLYKSRMEAGKKQFSGLFYFKSFPDSSYRIVLLSEFGLNLLDLEYKNHEFTVVTCKDFLNRKIFLNAIKSNLKLLIDLPQGYRQVNYFDPEGELAAVKFSKPFKKYYYFYENGIPERIVGKGFLKHFEVTTGEGANEPPGDIIINNKIIKLNINFKLLKTE